MDFVLHSTQRLLAMEVKATRKAHSADARPLVELAETMQIPGLDRGAQRLGLVVTRGREVELLAPNVWTVPYWHLFAPAR